MITSPAAVPASSPASARTALRGATRGEHELVDGTFSAFDLAVREGYRHFLRAQAAACLPVERALEAAGIGTFITDWSERRRAHLLMADLAELGDGTAIQEVESAPFATPAAALGGLYVLEGSRLGGAMLRRTLPDGFPAQFLGAPSAPGAWRALLDMLDDALRTATDLEAAIDAARSVFRSFALAGQAERERS